MSERIGAEHRSVVRHQHRVRMTNILPRLFVHNNLPMLFVRNVDCRNRDVGRLGPIPAYRNCFTPNIKIVYT